MVPRASKVSSLDTTVVFPSTGFRAYRRYFAAQSNSLPSIRRTELLSTSYYSARWTRALSVAGCMAATASASPTSQGRSTATESSLSRRPLRPILPIRTSSVTDGPTHGLARMYAQGMVGCQGVPSPCGRQTLWAKSSNNWGVIATMPKGNLSVLTYPDTQKLFTKEGVGSPTPISKFHAIRGHYAVQVPKRGDWEVAYDIWLDDWNIEVMIWLVNHGQTPAGDPIGKVHFYGQTFTVWRDSSKEPPYTLVLDHNQYSGTVHIKSAAVTAYAGCPQAQSDEQYG